MFTDCKERHIMSYCANALVYNEKMVKIMKKLQHLINPFSNIRKNKEEHKNSSTISRDYQLKV